MIKEEKKFSPTDLGIAVNDLLVEHFPDIVDVGFTSNMEEELDEVASGDRRWRARHIRVLRSPRGRPCSR